jgi:hypothetical protein
MYRNGDVDRINQSDSYGDRIYYWKDENKELIMHMFCFANDEEHAIKIVNEKRAQIISMNKWGEDLW